MKILIVDDSEAILRIERYAVLSGFPGAEVRFAASGQAALALVAEWAPDAVVADYHLPDTDGLRLLLALRKLLPEVPIGFASAEGDPQIVRRMQAAGAAFFLSMPFKFEDLVQAMRAALAPPAESAESAETGG